MSRRERRSVSLGRYRDRAPRDTSRGPQGNNSSTATEDGAGEVSTRHNISNYLLTLQRLQASEEENQHLRRENDLLRQRALSSRSRLSSASFRTDNSNQHHGNINTTLGSCSTTSSNGSGDCSSSNINNNNSNNNNNNNNTSNVVYRDAEDDKIAADVKRNSLLFVGDEIPASSIEHAALEAQYKKLQEDFETVKEFLKHLFQHALTMSSSSSSSTTTLPPSYTSSIGDHTLPLKSNNKGSRDVNTCSPTPTKQLERSLDDIHGQISQLKNSQDQQQVKMEQVQKALDNVLCQSSVRNDVTMRIVRQSDKMKELTKHSVFLEEQLAAASLAVRQAEEKSRQISAIGQDIDRFVSNNGRSLKGNPKDELIKIAGRLTQIGRQVPTCRCKMAALNNLVNHMTASVASGKSFAESRPSADVVDAMTKLERLIGSEWHRLGRMLCLPPNSLEEVGKFTNFDLTSRVEKVVTSWARLNMRSACPESLRQALDKMDRDALLLAEQPLCKDWQQLPPEVTTYVIAHVVDVPALVTDLSGQGVISADDRGFILDLPQEHRRASRLLQSVTYMGVSALALCCTALERFNQAPLAARIRDCLPSGQKKGSNSSFLTLDLNNRPASRQGGKSTNILASRYTSRDPNTSTSASTLHPSSLTANHYLYPTQSPSSSVAGSSTSSTSRFTSPMPSSSSFTNTPTSASSSGSKNSSEKQQRKKRSRSLFTRKNKPRETEPEPYDVDGPDEYASAADTGFSSVAPQAYSYNYYHPAVNPNALAAGRGAGGWANGTGERGRSSREVRGDRSAHRRSGNWGGEASDSGGSENSQPWVRNPHHQHYQDRPRSRHINMGNGGDEVAV